MAQRGERFTLDLDADNFAPVLENDIPDGEGIAVSKEIREHDPTGIPSAPKQKANRTGFPEHRTRSHFSTFRKQQFQETASATDRAVSGPPVKPTIPTQVPPSDRAIAHHLSKKYGYNHEAQQKADISSENKRKIAEMSDTDIEEARAELMASLNPAFIERLLKKANIDDEVQMQPKSNHRVAPDTEKDLLDEENKSTTQDDRARRSPPLQETSDAQQAPEIHFPVPPRAASSFVPLDPNSPTFLADLKTHYFPDTPHDPSSLTWLQDPTADETKASEYNPTNSSYSPSSLRFSFTGTLIPPKESLEIDVSKGLHHHGLAPESAGYSIPELAILARSTLPNQRCIAYQVIGRILFRLGRGDFGPRGSELQEGLWNVVEKERVVDTVMREANREGKGGHVSAKAYATEALWLWRKGGGGDRGVLKEGEKRAT